LLETGAKLWGILGSWKKPIVTVQNPKESEGFIVQEKGPKYIKQRPFVVLYFWERRASIMALLASGSRKGSHPIPFPT
jgi:hypothetical protein